MDLNSRCHMDLNSRCCPDCPQILYFFPGLQNIDWIPKVDPEPTSAHPFDIIQPVLQYPGGGLFSRGWALKSWYVTVNGGALYSKAITKIQPGDAILCNMTRTGPDSWRVSGALKSDPSKSTVQEATNSRLRLQPWAYRQQRQLSPPQQSCHLLFTRSARPCCTLPSFLPTHCSVTPPHHLISAVAECYGCDGCATYPTKPIVFSENKLYQGGKLVEVPGKPSSAVRACSMCGDVMEAFNAKKALVWDWPDLVSPLPCASRKQKMSGQYLSCSHCTAVPERHW